MQNLKVIFLPGNGGDGSTTYGWFPYVKKELESLGLQVLTPTFPDGELARASYWLPFLDTLGVDQNTILIGHSSGAIAAMRYAEEHVVRGSVLVSAYHTTLGIEAEVLSGYFEKDWNWNAIKDNQEFIIQFNSTNDPFIPIEEARYVHEKLGTDYHELNQGHFYPQEAFPELIEAIKRVIGDTER